MAPENIDMIVVKMLVTSGKGDDSQWFDYRPGFYSPIVRIEWELDTMEAAIDSQAAEYLIKHGYAVRVSPEQEPEPLIVQETEDPVVIEMGDEVPSPSQPPAQQPDPPAESPPPPVEAPQVVEASASTASSGGKQKKKEKSK